MKNKILLAVLLLMGIKFSAQTTNDIWRTTEVFRIPVKEKINLPLRKFPVELIRAYCEGSIKAYYPLDTTKECSYHEFMAHFNLGVAQPDPAASGDEFQTAPCPQTFCKGNDESMLENFLVYIELLQVKRFDKNKSMETIDVKYVRLKYVYTKHDLEVVIDGPVFKYADIAALAQTYPDWYKVPNYKNTAENFTMKKIIESRMFTGNVVVPKNKPKVYPENKKNNTEHDQWNH
ncbi:MAG: hypothetical protein IAF38_16805 [Bacteroidia bacterium]|nr:hypothetical protein [Bacteroidia bacterium]